MDIGISSSCFYPTLTEEAFKTVGELGAKSAEIFFNSSEELHGSILKRITDIKDYYGIDVRTIHPFTSFAEPFMLFGGYERRVSEAVEFYKRYFEAACALGSEAVVIHGGFRSQAADEAAYFESFSRLCETAREYGIFAAHETVVEKAGSDIEFLKRLKAFLGQDFKLIIDTKQCRRSKTDEYEYIKLFGDDIIQIHISDYNESKDCIPPGEGEYEFKKLFSSLKSVGYNKSAVIELYSWGFSDIAQIEKSRIYLENIDRNC